MASNVPVDMETAAAERYCPACGAVSSTAFCGDCGAQSERVPDLSLRRFFASAVRELTNLDSRLLTTLHALLLRPGLLSREYLRGRGGRFIGPLRIFFLANVLYFAAHTFFLPEYTFTTSLATQLNLVPPVELKRALVERKLIAEDITLAELAPRWDAVAAGQGKTLVVLLIPIYAVILALVLVHRRRPPVQHIVFATHIVAFVLLLLIIFRVGMMSVFSLTRLVSVNLQVLGTDSVSSLMLGAILALYLAPALRRGYDLGLPATVSLAPILVLGFLVALQLYRFALFFSVYLAI